MDTQLVLQVDEETMKMAKQNASKSGKSLEEILENHIRFIAEDKSSDLKDIMRVSDNYDRQDDFFDDAMDTEDIVIEEDTMYEIRKIAAETGKTQEELAERFKEILHNLSLQISDEDREWHRTVAYYSNKKNLKKAV